MPKNVKVVINAQKSSPTATEWKRTPTCKYRTANLAQNSSTEKVNSQSNLHLYVPKIALNGKNPHLLKRENPRCHISKNSSSKKNPTSEKLCMIVWAKNNSN